MTGPSITPTLDFVHVGVSIAHVKTKAGRFVIADNPTGLIWLHPPTLLWAAWLSRNALPCPTLVLIGTPLAQSGHWS